MVAAVPHAVGADPFSGVAVNVPGRSIACDDASVRGARHGLRLSARMNGAKTAGGVEFSIRVYATSSPPWLSRLSAVSPVPNAVTRSRRCSGVTISKPLSRVKSRRLTVFGVARMSLVTAENPLIEASKVRVDGPSNGGSGVKIQ